MNGAQQSQSRDPYLDMGGRQAAARSLDAKPKPVSPCDDAQSQIGAAQADLEHALDGLFARLNSACNPGPCVGANDSKPDEEPAASELHGRLLGIAQRTRQHAAAVRDVTSRLTL